MNNLLGGEEEDLGVQKVVWGREEGLEMEEYKNNKNNADQEYMT